MNHALQASPVRTLGVYPETSSRNGALALETCRRSYRRLLRAIEQAMNYRTINGVRVSRRGRGSPLEAHGDHRDPRPKIAGAIVAAASPEAARPCFSHGFVASVPLVVTFCFSRPIHLEPFVSAPFPLLLCQSLVPRPRVEQACVLAIVLAHSSLSTATFPSPKHRSFSSTSRDQSPHTTPLW